jgi:hypothetical protein
MGIIKLNEHYVKLIKHLNNIGLYNDKGISDFLNGMIKKRQVNYIVNGKRWGHIPTPSLTEGHYLLFKFKMEGKL